MIVLDADVLGRERTGDETYMANLLRELPRAAPDLRFAAVTRHPELVPDGVEPIELPAGSQEVRMAWSLPRLLRRLEPELAHFQHALPLAWHGRSVVTLHDLSFESDASSSSGTSPSHVTLRGGSTPPQPRAPTTRSSPSTARATRSRFLRGSRVPTART